MTVKADWEHTETSPRGSEFEVIIPLQGLDDVSPKEDKIISQTIAKAGEENPGEDNLPLWNKVRFDRPSGRLHLLVSCAPEVGQIKDLIATALISTNEQLEQNERERQQSEAEAKAAALRSQKEADELRNAFRSI
jgi:hypothetical protein